MMRLYLGGYIALMGDCRSEELVGGYQHLVPGCLPDVHRGRGRLTTPTGAVIGLRIRGETELYLSPGCDGNGPRRGR